MLDSKYTLVVIALGVMTISLLLLGDVFQIYFLSLASLVIFIIFVLAIMRSFTSFFSEGKYHDIPA